MSGVLPAGSCDCHCHVFGPAARFPYAEPRSYTPDDAPLEAYLALLDRLGFDRGVLVQPSAYGRDNTAMLDALIREPARLRGVAVGAHLLGLEAARAERGVERAGRRERRSAAECGEREQNQRKQERTATSCTADRRAHRARRHATVFH